MGLSVNGIAMDGSAPVPRSLLRTVGVITGVLGMVTALLAWPWLAEVATTRAAEGRVVAVERGAVPGTPAEGERRDDPALVIAFRTADGREVRITQQRRLLHSPEFWLGQTMPVRYRPEAPEAATVGETSDLTVPPLIAGVITALWGAIWAMLLRGSVLYRRRRAKGGAAKAQRREQPRRRPKRPKRAVAGARAGGGTAVPAQLIGLRRKDTAEGPRWIVQAQAADPRSGAERLIESDPLPFDPVLQMRDTTSVRVVFEGGARGAARMDLSFLQHPGA